MSEDASGEVVKTSLGLFVSECKLFTREGSRAGFIGFAKIVLNGCFLLDAIELHQTGEGKYYLEFPIQQKPGNGRSPYRLFHPTNSETNKLLLDAVLSRLKYYQSKRDSGERFELERLEEHGQSKDKEP